MILLGESVKISISNIMGVRSHISEGIIFPGHVTTVSVKLLQREKKTHKKEERK